MMKKRNLKSTTKRKERTSCANPQCMSGVRRTTQGVTNNDAATVYHGARGRYHYFVCQQFVLRIQIEAVTKLWDLPPEFEVRISTRMATTSSLKQM